VGLIAAVSQIKQLGKNVMGKAIDNTTRQAEKYLLSKI